MKKYLIQVLLPAAVAVFFTACDVISPANLDSFVFENSVDPQSTFYCGEESTDTDGDGIGDYLDADEIILLEPEDGAEVTTSTPVFSIKAKSASVVSSYGFILSENSDLSSPLINLSGTDSPSYTLSKGVITECKTFYWSGTVTGSDGSVYTSGIRSFTVNTAVSSRIIIDGGSSFTLAVTDSGTVKSWGRNYNGQLGDGSTDDTVLPAVIPDLTDILEVAAGDLHSLALKNDGTVWSWGANSEGQLGLGDTADRSSPVKLDLEDIVSISAGMEHSMALGESGTVFTWGDNLNGQLGDNSTDDRTAPVQVLLEDGETPLSDIVEICASGHLSVALKDDGTVWTWGENGYGALGAGGVSERHYASQVSGVSGVIGISCGGTYSDGSNWCSVFVIQTDKTLKAWGYNRYGQLGDGNGSLSNKYSYEPVNVSDITGVVSVVSGSTHEIALTESGEVWSWGNDSSGGLGNGDEGSCLSPELIDGISGIKNIGSGSGHSMAMSADGDLYAWGSNWFGQLGDGTETTRTSPVEITAF